MRHDLTRRTLVKAAAGAAAALGGSPRAAAQAGPAPYLLLVYASGGWDTSMVFDNKLAGGFVAVEPSSQAGTGGGNLPFVDDPSRPATKQFFTTFGAGAAIVNGLYVGALDHRQAVRNVFGAVPPKKNRPVDWLSFYVASQNPALDLPHVVIDAPYLPGESEGVAVRLTTATIKEYGAAAPAAAALGDAGEAALAAFRQNALSGAPAAASQGGLDFEKLTALAYGAQREPLVAAALAKAQATLGAPGPDSDFLRNGKLALELFAQGSSLAATVQAGADDAWDSTTANFSRQAHAYEALFADLSALLKYAAARSIDSQLLVVVLSEMGRSPVLNAAGGKGPWPYTSALVWGAGIAGGTVAGLTDAQLRGVPVDPTFGTQGGKSAVTLEMANLFAGIYLKTGVPVKLMVPDSPPLSTIFKEAT